MNSYKGILQFFFHLIQLSINGMEHIETESSIGVTYTEEYRELLQSATFLPERAYNAITGQKIDLAPGTCANVLDDDGGSSYLSGGYGDGKNP